MNQYLDNIRKNHNSSSPIVAILLMRFFRGLEPEDLSAKVFRQKALSVAVIIVGSLMLTIK